MANIKNAVKLGVFTLAIMNVTAVVSLRGLPAEAVYGMSSAFYYLFAAIVFLIPTSLVAAELAAMFQDKQGGVFRWVGEAYGKKLGFLAIWEVMKDITPYLLISGGVIGTSYFLTIGFHNLYVLLILKIGIAVSLYVFIMWIGKSVIFFESVQFIRKKLLK